MTKKTVLHGQHLQLGARMGPFGGWDMPIQYSGILQEHQHTRSHASVFDICHMGEFELSGPTALEDLERLLTCRIANLKVGQVRYGYMLDESGGTLDDLTVYHLEPQRYMLVVNAGTAPADSEWIRAHLSPETRFEDRSDALAKLDVQGPESRDVLEEVLGCTLPDLGYFRFREFEAEGLSIILSRTGYTGEWGYELYLPPAAAGPLWSRLVAHPLCEPAGLGARDTLRMEMGYPLYGHELTSTRTPADVSGGAFVDLEKGFIGKEALEGDLSEGSYQLVGLRFSSKRAAREGDRILFKEDEVGEVTSGSVAPSLGVAAALARLQRAVAAPGSIVDVEIRGKAYPAEVVSLPLYSEGTARGREGKKRP